MSGLDCNPCRNGRCALPIYKQFAMKYENINEEEEDSLELTDDVLISLSEIEIEEDTLMAKRKYLKYHHHRDEDLQHAAIACKFTHCYGLKKLLQSPNSLTELEQAHATFAHPEEFSKYRKMDNRTSHPVIYDVNTLIQSQPKEQPEIFKEENAIDWKTAQVIYLQQQLELEMYCQHFIEQKVDGSLFLIILSLSS